MNKIIEKYISSDIDTEIIFENIYDDNDSDAKEVLKNLIEELPSIKAKELSNILDLVIDESIAKVNKKEASIILISTMLTITAKKRLNYQLYQHEKNLWIHNSKKWIEIDSKLLIEFLKNAANKIGISQFISSGVAFVNKLQKQIMQDAYFEISLSKDVTYLNVNNGIISITKKKIGFISHNPKLFLTHCMDIEYNSNKKYKELEFLNKIIPSIDAQKSLQQSIAQILIKDYSNSKRICMYNLDNDIFHNFLNTIKDVIPNEIITNYFNNDAELEDMFIDSKEIKNDPYLLEILTVIPCEALTTEELDNAIINQINKVDIFYWLIDGVKDIIKNGKTYISKECEDFKDRFNTVKIFVEESNFVKTPKHSKSIVTTYKSVLKHYESFCELHDEEPLGRGTFNKELKALAFESTRRDSGNVWFAKFA